MSVSASDSQETEPVIFGAMRDPRRQTLEWGLGAGLLATRLSMRTPSLLVRGALLITRAL